jgi:hypothetical protein
MLEGNIIRKKGHDVKETSVKLCCWKMSWGYFNFSELFCVTCWQYTRQHGNEMRIETLALDGSTLHVCCWNGAAPGMFCRYVSPASFLYEIPSSSSICAANNEVYSIPHQHPVRDFSKDTSFPHHAQWQDVFCSNVSIEQLLIVLLIGRLRRELEGNILMVL